MNSLAGDRPLGLAQGSRPLALEFLGLLSLLLPLSENLGVFGSSEPVLLAPPPPGGEPVSLALQHHGGDQALDLGGSELLLLALLQGQGALDHVLAHVVLLGQVEELPDLGCPPM